MSIETEKVSGGGKKKVPAGHRERCLARHVKMSSAHSVFDSNSKILVFAILTNGCVFKICCAVIEGKSRGNR